MQLQTVSERTRRRPGRFVRRLLAFVVDGIVLALLAVVLLWLVSMLLGPAIRLEVGDGAASVSVTGWRVLLNAVVSASLSAAYFVVSWTRWRRSPGQTLLGVEVEDVRRTDPSASLSAPRAIVRWALLGGPLGLAAAVFVNSPLVFAAVSLVTLGWFALLVLTTLFSRSGRGLHDRIAGTVVVAMTGR
jgi:uncharacterized RDD family membrane protein YckC